MVFSSVPFYLDPPNWQQQADHQAGSSSENPQLPPPPPPEGGGGGGSIRPGSMADRARLAKLPQPDAPQKCPRCDSNNTKFCYFNNYSLSQPRHFCKTCRRYWTRGGALRSVPVGGGCRRNKRSKASSSKSQASVEHHQTSTGSTSAIPSNSYTNDIRGPIPALSPPPPQLPFMASLQHLSDYGPMDIGLNYGGILPSLAATGVGVGGRDMDYQMGSNSGSGGTILSAGGNEQWRLQQVQQFPFLTGLEPPPGLYPFEGEGVGSPSYAGGAAQLRGKSSGSSVTQLASVKMEDSRGLNLSRQFLGIPGNDQYWGGGNAWTDLSGFNS